MPWLLVLACILLLCLLTRGPRAQDFDDVVSPWAAASPFGINTHHRSGTEEIQTFAETGAKWMRMHYAPWAVVEPEKGLYRFAPEFDRFVEAWRDADVQILDILCYGNPVHTGSDDPLVAPFGEEQIRAYADYVYATVSHYKPWTKHWEIWNEPNGRGFWKPNPFPDAYLELLKAAYEAAKRADPECVVVGGAVSGTALPFLDRVFALGGASYMDVLSIHPYRPRFEASCESSGYVEQLAAVRELLDRHRPDLPIWVTEIGWPTTPWEGSGSVSPARQADYLVRMYVLSVAAGVERIFWYHYRDGNQFGLVQGDFTEKPAYAAYRTMTRVLEGAACRGQVKAPHGIWSVAFERNDQDLLVCWAPDGAIEIDLLGNEVRRWDVAGRPFRAQDGPIRLALGPPPIYAAGFNLSVVAR